MPIVKTSRKGKVSKADIDKAFKLIRLKLNRVLFVHPDRGKPFNSTHEGLGVLTEEYQELIEAIRSNDLRKVCKEAIDVAVTAAFILASDIYCGRTQQSQQQR
jgi:hypothetical protein